VFLRILTRVPPLFRTVVSVAPVGLSGGGTMYSPAVAGRDLAVMAVACDMGRLYLSADTGASWQLLDQREMHHGQPAVRGLAPLDAPAGRLCAGHGRSSGGRRAGPAPVSLSTSTGAWTRLPLTPQLAHQEFVTALLVRGPPTGRTEGDDARHVYLGTTQGAYLRSPGGAADWQPIAVPFLNHTRAVHTPDALMFRDLRRGCGSCPGRPFCDRPSTPARSCAICPLPPARLAAPVRRTLPGPARPGPGPGPEQATQLRPTVPEGTETVQTGGAPCRH
jgi:hypothetical protein